MDYPIQELQFLDLSDADEEECNFLQTTLFPRNPNLLSPELPWVTHSDSSCTPAEWRPAPYAVAPIPHPTLRGVFLPPPMYAPGPPALGLVPTVPAPGEPVNSSSAVTAVLDGSDCDSVAQQNTPSAAHQIPDVSQEPQTMAGPHATNSIYPDASVMSIPTSVPAPVPPSVMTTMYHHQIVSGLPLPNVYVGNVTANVNVHGYLSTYPHISPQQVYPSEGPHETVNPSVRNGGREARRGRSSKLGNKRMDVQYGDRNSSGRHTQEAIQVQQSPLVETSTANSSLAQQGYPQFFPINSLPHPFQTPYYNPSTPAHPASHLPPHPSAQHATGPPIYMPGHPIYPPPHMYRAYAPHHQAPGGPPIMPFTAIQTAPVPTTETSVLRSYQVEGSGAEERLPLPTGNMDIELGEASMHQQKLPPSSVCATSYQPQPLPEVCHTSLNSNTEAVESDGVDNSNPIRYQQQQSEEEDFTQSNLVNTVVVNNSNIVTEPPPFIENKQSGVVDSISRNLLQSTVHQNFIKSDVQPKFVTEKDNVSTVGVVMDDNVALNQEPTINSEASANGNAVVSELDLKREKTIVGVDLPSAVEKSQITDVKYPLSHVDTPVPAVTSPKSAHGPLVDGVIPFTSSPQPASTSVAVQHQNVTVLPPGSNPIDLQNAQVATPVGKTWASLFKPNSKTAGGMITGSPASRTQSGNKPLACVKPFQNAVPVTPDASLRVPEGSSAPQSPAANHGVSIATGDNVKSFPQLHSLSSTDDPHLYQLGEFLMKYQLEHKALSLQPRGLTNRSNWCYINSTLQALLACPPFYNLMKALSLFPKRSGKSTTPIIDSMVQFVDEFMPLSAASRLRDRKEKALRKDDGSIEVQCGTPFEPSYIYKMLNCIRSDTFKVEGRQEDAEEFLGCLLNALNDEMLELIKLVEEPPTKSTLSNGDIATNGDTSTQSQDEDDREWTVMGPKNKGSITRRADFGRTPISDIFRGQLRSRVQRAGDQSTDNVQPFFTLQLDIEKAQSVKDALEILVGRDQLEGVTCSRTNQEVEAWQQVTLEELPLVLLLHLKLFDYKLDGASKIMKCVEFPIDLKVDPKLMSSNKKCGPKQRQYKLFAVVYHDGKEASKGHYITDVFHVGYGGWVRYDDSVVKAVQESHVLRPRGPRVPYLLYYRRCDTIGNPQPAPSPALDKTR
ncbi:ubiquitin carboxyl-terminal hydrolase 10-B isoform X3 [Zootermopsis nevadensis]|uniref:ubiquitinyl hydrolase 1 n=1 Tax=Zootermopsis nevadensis TaxID=136037 RepID=A0A067RDY0_ZOONE|nr:ubiquitin carboxyl-terminal hydrolase 10-B isoform X3 [Zootermopsis nevadensis]KDR21218.1 Ubiquitin carboxyl-terminal hydrolase 10 [Zootermopsis nevadensis]